MGNEHILQVAYCCFQKDFVSMKISKTGKENGRLVKPKVFFSFLYEYPFAFIYQKYFKSTLVCNITMHLDVGKRC